MNPRHRLPRLALTVGAAALALTTAVAPEAMAGGPGDRTPAELAFPLVFAAGDVCPFAVTITLVAENEYTRTFPDGSIHGSGRLAERITNDRSGTSVVRNLSGPGVITFDDAGRPTYLLSGVSLGWVTQGADLTGTVGQGLFIWHGPTRFNADLQLVAHSGSEENLCLTLAGP